MANPLLASLAEISAGQGISLLWSAPFVLLLACIALMPFIHRHWWEKWYPAVAVGLGAVAAGYYFLIAPSAAKWFEEMESYVSFAVLLAALYVVSGGIIIHVNRLATPAANCALLAFGAVASNIFGTTGASMLLIRPFLRMNRDHLKPFHVVFFIFIVSNTGGLLTPIGDPPLFLGYLNGVPFWWVFEHCRWLWLVVNAALLAVFFVLDKIDHGRTERKKPDDPGPAVFIHGIHNLLFIALIIWAVFQPGLFDQINRMREQGFSTALAGKVLLSREVLMAAAGIGSLLLTGKAIYQRNEFTYGPIREVAILFLGIFSTMAPALQWLHVNAEKLAVTTPAQFYFRTGMLSAVLDNAPTYMTFLEAELGKLDQAKVRQAAAEAKRWHDTKTMEIDPTLDWEVKVALEAIKDYHADEIKATGLTLAQVEVGFLLGEERLNLYIIAISAGAVLFGACTYIGNGPNFMVKSIAEASGAKMPSFLGYVLKYTLPVLVPVYLVIWLVFFFAWK